MRYYGTAFTNAEKEVPVVKRFKDFNASIACLKAVLTGDNIRPEQRQNVEAAIEQLRRLWRKPDVKKHDVYLCIREITERLIKAFIVK